MGKVKILAYLLTPLFICSVGQSICCNVLMQLSVTTSETELVNYHQKVNT